MINKAKSLFITGGTGSIGSKVIKEFLKNNWEITAFVRDTEKASSLSNLGVKLIKGSLSDYDLLFESSKNFDAVIHTARDATADKNTIDANVVKVLLNSTKETSLTKHTTLIYTSGCLTIGERDDIVDEETVVTQPHAYGAFRIELENLLLSQENKIQNRSIAVIRPGWVYGREGSFVGEYLKYALKEKYVSLPTPAEAYVNFIHIDDLSRIYFLIVEKTKNGLYHGTDGKYIVAKEFVKSVANKLNLEIKEENQKDAYSKYGFFALGLNINQKIISKKYEELGFNLEYGSILEHFDKIIEQLNESK